MYIANWPVKENSAEWKAVMLSQTGCSLVGARRLMEPAAVCENFFYILLLKKRNWFKKRFLNIPANLNF